MTTEVTAPITGTVDVEAGAVAADVDLLHRIWLGLTLTQPCPTCSSGSCVGGPRNGLACTPHGTSTLFGDTLSLDCPAAPIASSIAALPLAGTLETGTQTLTVSAANPSCTGAGYSSFRCLCDTCQTATGEGCSTNADCPPGRTCGGLRCLSGSPLGGPCTVPFGSDGACSGGFCGIPGEPTQPNDCIGNVCTPNALDLDSSDEGACTGGPFYSYCSIDTYLGCIGNSDCRPPGEGGSCGGCAPGLQTCTSAPLQCFTTNGVIGTDVISSGVADPPSGGAFDPTVSGLFCAGATTASAANAAIGLPGMSRRTIRTTALLY
jgi:hypothetical protein